MRAYRAQNSDDEDREKIRVTSYGLRAHRGYDDTNAAVEREISFFVMRFGLGGGGEKGFSLILYVLWLCDMVMVMMMSDPC